MSKGKATQMSTRLDCKVRGKCIAAYWCGETQKMVCYQWEKSRGTGNRRR